MKKLIVLIVAVLLVIHLGSGIGRSVVVDGHMNTINAMQQAGV